MQANPTFAEGKQGNKGMCLGKLDHQDSFYSFLQRQPSFLPGAFQKEANFFCPGPPMPPAPNYFCPVLQYLVRHALMLDAAAARLKLLPRPSFRYIISATTAYPGVLPSGG